MKKRGVIIALSLALVLVAAGMIVSVAAGGIVAGNFHQADKVAAVDQTFAVSGMPTLSVEDRNGTITITHGNDNTIVVHAVKRAATDELLSKLNVEMHQDGNTITVQTTGDLFNGFAFFGSDRTAVDYEILVPAHTDLAPVRSANGRIDVSGIAGRLDLHTSNGLITARDVDGSVTAVSSNGRVVVSGGRGALQLSTSNGIVEVQNVQSQGIDLHTSNGKIAFTGSLAPGSKNRADTDNGTISFTIPSDSTLSIDLQSGNGSVNVGFPVTTAPGTVTKRNAVQGVIGRADADLTMRSGNGSITLGPLPRGGSAATDGGN